MLGRDTHGTVATRDSDKRFLRVAERALAWAQGHDYVGPDGLGRPLSLRNPAATVAALGSVLKTHRAASAEGNGRDPDGVALFARAWLRHSELDSNEPSRDNARDLLEWLLVNAEEHEHGLSWASASARQDLGVVTEPGEPSPYVTVVVAKALLHAFEVLGERRYLEAATRAADYAAGAQNLALAPRSSSGATPLVVAACCASLLAEVGRHGDEPTRKEDGRRLAAWVAERALMDGSWPLTDPPIDAYTVHFAHHTGQIVDALLHYERAAGDDAFVDTRRRGLDFYRDHLFTHDWRPKWNPGKRYPHDIQGYAQGILTFAESGELEFARCIADAAIHDMWDASEGRFYYQRHRFSTNKARLMRWGHAWMAYALITLAEASALAR